MDRFIELIFKNKIVVAIFATVILIVIIVAIGAVLSDKKDNKENGITTELTTDASKENNIKESEDTTTKTPESTEVESDTSNETENEETTKQPETTEPTTNTDTIVEYPYIIKVNRAANCTTVYGKDSNGNYTVPVKAITVSCGKVIEDTPLGEFNTIISYDWRLMFDGTYGHYAYRIVGSTLFHSVPYYTASNDNLEWMEYNKLGSPASLGCVRMTVADAKWLVDNCPVGTTVIIYDDANNPGPLGKPETIKIPENSPYRGWDPTDPHPNNPWHQFSATITYPSTQLVNIEEGSSESKLRSYFSAKDTCGNSINDKIKISGQYDLKVPGTYGDIIVSVTDAIGSYAEVKVTVVVKAKEVETTTKEPQSEVTTEATTAEKETTTNQNVTENESTSKEDDTTSEDETIKEEVTKETDLNIEDNIENGTEMEE